MAGISKSELVHLYEGKDIQTVWNEAKTLPVIEHPVLGYISPNYFRELYVNKPCPYCAKKMVRGQDIHATDSKEEAKKRGYEYFNLQGEKVINQAGHTYFHPNYITIDHKINKARCPQKMFDYDNLQAVCWQCNKTKGDDNTYDSRYNRKYLKSLVDETVRRYGKFDQSKKPI